MCNIGQQMCYLLWMCILDVGNSHHPFLGKVLQDGFLSWCWKRYPQEDLAPPLDVSTHKLPSHPSPILMCCCRYLGNMVFGLGGTQELSLPMMTVLRRFLCSLAQFQTLCYPHTGSQYSWLWLESSTSWRFPSSLLWERHNSLISDAAHYGGPVVCLSDDLRVRTCSC